MGTAVMPKDHLPKVPRICTVPTDLRPTIDEIKRHVAKDAGIPLIKMIDRCNEWWAAHERQIAMYLACRLTVHSYPFIGRRFGGRDHTTIIHAYRAVTFRSANDPELAERITRLEGELIWSAAWRPRVGPTITVATPSEHRAAA